MKIVLKIGGNEIDDPSFLTNVSRLAARIQKDNHQVVLVHGGGKEVTGLLDKLGIKSRFVKGFRYTDPQILDAVEMTLSGLINKRLVRSLQQSGARAIGLSGVDAKILVAKATKRDGEDVGLVGEVTEVNSPVLEELMRKFIIVLSPISIDRDSTSSLNVNADYAAAAVASSLKSKLTIFLSDVPGVINNGKLMTTLREAEFEELTQSGVIVGGMLPKVEAALRALKQGAKSAFITDVDGAMQVVSGQAAGTQVIV